MPSSILFILHLPPPVHGAAMMGKYIKDSALVNQTFDCRFINLTAAESLQDIGAFRWRKISGTWNLLKKIRAEVKAKRPDLVYFTANATGMAFYRDWLVVQMLKAWGCRIVVHYHNKGVRTRQHRWLDNMLYRKFFKGLKVILLAESLYQDVAKYVDRKDVLICPNGIPFDKGYEPATRRHNAVPRILFLSNLIESKGVLVLLDALKILKEQGYHFACDFVGSETAEISSVRFQQEVEARGLADLTVFHGKKYGAEKEAYLENADIFTLPSSNETFGLVNLEAMQHKLPIVSTNEGGIPEVVRNGLNGLIVEVQDGKVQPKQLAEKIALLLNDETLRQEMGEAGYKLFREHYTVEKFESAITATLANIQNGGGKQIIRLLGPKFGAQKSAILQHADIFVFPTYYPNECFPLVLLEAMQQHLPIISTHEGGIPEMVMQGRNGMLVEASDKTALAKNIADKIALLLNDETLRQEMGEAGFQLYNEHFTLHAFEQRIAVCLQACLASQADCGA